MQDDIRNIHYRGWDIVPFVIPTSDGNWCANCEIEKLDESGMNTFQGALQTFLRTQKDEAITAACDDAKRHIDDILADPLH